MRGTRTGPVRQESGFALLIVLWFLVLIAAMGTFLLTRARSEIAVARNLTAAAAAENLADAAVARTAFTLLVGTPVMKADGTGYRFTLGKGVATVRLGDETQKINPNLATPEVMAGLFETTGLTHARAQRLAAALGDWIDADEAERPFGGERNAYRNAGRSYTPANARFETLDDLQLVLGMTPEVLAAVLPYLTIYTRKAAPPETTAPPLIRRALLMAKQNGRTERAVAPAPQNFDPDAPEQSDRDDGDDADNEDATDADDAASDDEVQDGDSSDAPAQERVIQLSIDARSSNGGRFVRNAVLRLEPNNPKGYVVLAWSRGQAE